MKIATCWDDGVEDDLRLIEIFRKYGAKATFNLNIGLHQDGRDKGWTFKNIKQVRKLAKGELLDAYEGFTIANHSLTHPALNKIPLEDAKREIREGRDKLEQFFGKSVTGFAYPFGAYDPPICDILRETGHIYARTVKKAFPVLPVADPMEFHPTCHFLEPDFWERVEQVRAVDGVLYFWGHSYENVTAEDWAALDEKIARLSKLGNWVELPTLFS